MKAGHESHSQPMTREPSLIYCDFLACNYIVIITISVRSESIKLLGGYEIEGGNCLYPKVDERQGAQTV